MRFDHLTSNVGALRFGPEPVPFITIRPLDRDLEPIQTDPMSDVSQTLRRETGDASALLRLVALGFCYWLVFLLVLEPDNVLKAAGTSYGLVWYQELARILGAAALGASVTPLLSALVRRYAVEGRDWPRPFAMQVLGSGVIAAILIFLSCVLADRLLVSERRPFLVALPQEFQANWTLVTFAIGGLLAILNGLRVRTPRAPEEPEYLTRVAAKTRGRVFLVDFADVDWIEAQGNYVALHTPSDIHLVRQTLAQLERGLDPKRFARIHRRTIIAVDRVATVKSLGAGDGLVRLKNGSELRLSRGFRDRVDAFIH